MIHPTYDQKALEKKWQQVWLEMNIHQFDPKSTKPVFSIDVPPRYASGPLHAGHAVHYTHIDFSARYKRLRGYNVFFPLCFDVNGIPIEERVERQLNITRKDIDRHEFTKLCSEFANKNIQTMTESALRLNYLPQMVEPIVEALQKLDKTTTLAYQEAKTGDYETLIQTICRVQLCVMAFAICVKDVMTFLTQSADNKSERLTKTVC